MRYATITHQRSSQDTELLIRFALKRLSEIESDQTEPPPVLIALVLAAAFQQQRFYDRLKEDVISSSARADEVMRMSHKLFIPALWGLLNDQGAEENLLPDEEDCKQVLHYALDEGRRILAEMDFEFLQVFNLLIRVGLFRYSFRLYEFECVGQSLQGDPENLIRKGVEIIEDALGVPRSEN